MRSLLRWIPLSTLALLAACRPAPPPAEPVRAVRTMLVGSGPVNGEHEYAGEVRARIESRLGFRVGGKMASRRANLGDSVRAGQVLATLDPTDLRLGVEAAEAALKAAKSAYDFSAAELRRFGELKDQGFISGWELERRETALANARAQFEQAQVQAQAQRNQARYASLVADAAGVITAIEAEPGAVLGAGAPVVRLAHDGPRDVVFSVPEDRISALRTLSGRAGAIQVVLWPGGHSPRPATVREVAASADPATRTFIVKADLGPDAPVRLGQTATIRVTASPSTSAIRLPLAAVIEHQGGAAVWLLDRDSMTVRPQHVQVAGADGNEVLIASGLAVGQTVVTAGTHVLTVGQKVRQYMPNGHQPAATASR
jgi:membrane fusion protein, multidrug efflux system